MMRILKYVMKVFYANENYAKYGYPGIGYFMALMGTTFYIMLTGFMVVSVLGAIFPAFDKYETNISSKTPTLLSGILILGSIFLFLRILIKEESLKDSSFTKEKVNKAVNYLIAYALGTILVGGYLGLKLFHQ